MKKKLNNGPKGRNHGNIDMGRWVQEFRNQNNKGVFPRFATCAAHILCKFNTNM